MKWLKNPESVTQEELDANRKSAWDAWDAWDTYTSATSAGAAAAWAADVASYWVDEYFESTGEDKQTYIDALGE